MRLFFSLALISIFFSSSAQETITYPYNPDGDVDGAIASPDLLDLLGDAFTPTEIQIDGVGLAEIIGQLQADNATLTQQITDLQNADNDIDSTNEIQTLNLNGDTLRISGGNYILLSSLSYNLPINISMDSIQYDNAGVVTFNAEVLPSAGTITDKGFCWSTSNPIPSIYDEFESVSTGVGSFSFVYYPDTDSVTYYVRAYAVSEQGMSYSDVFSFDVSLHLGMSFAGGIIFELNSNGSGTVYRPSLFSTWPSAVNSQGHANCNVRNSTLNDMNNTSYNGYNDWEIGSTSQIMNWYIVIENLEAEDVISFSYGHNLLGYCADNGVYLFQSGINTSNSWVYNTNCLNHPPPLGGCDSASRYIIFRTF